MTLSVPRSIAAALGFDLAVAVSDFKAALEAHALTTDEPAPTAPPLVEEIVRAHAGDFVIVDDTPVLDAAQKRNALFVAIATDETGRLDAIMSPARRHLANIDFVAIGRKMDTERTSAEVRRMADLQAAFARLADVQRHSALLMIEVEDLPEGQLDGWTPYGWPS